MRAAFGLLGVLVTIGVIIWVIIALTPATQKAAKNVGEQKDIARQFAGYDVNGLPAGDTIWLAPDMNNGKMTGAIVTKIRANGAMETHFGLKKDDTIVQIGPQPITDIGSADAAKDFLVDAFQKNLDIVVIRDEKKITLPAQGQTAAANSGAPANAESQKNPLQRQLDQIQKVPTH